MRHGFLLIDKPVGPTSHDIVAMVRRALNERKVGHLGTLDPRASGLMVLAVGAKALKVVELFSGLTKRYRADVRFGAVSSTYDAEGVIEEVSLKPGQVEPDRIAIQNAIEDRFLGKIEQVPPAASAIHIDGERAYKAQRLGKEVEMPSRKVEISVCDIVNFTYPDLVLDVACSSGTYIRSLAHDLGTTLRSGAYLSDLRRTRVGEWSIDDAVTTDDAKWTDVKPLKEVLKGLPQLELSEEQWQKMQHGIDIEGEVEPDTIAWFDALPVAVLEEGKKAPGTVHARKVFA